MQEEVNDKTIALCVRTTRMTAGVLRSALMMLLREKYYRSRYGANRKQEPDITVHGKKSMKQLMDEGCELTNIEITDNNIKSFEKVARTYSVDYSLKKDSSMDPPRYMVFFRARDVDVMTAAFREYTGISMSKEEKKSVTQTLQKAMDRTKVISHRERDRSKEKNRGFER